MKTTKAERQEARRQALYVCASLIRAQIESGLEGGYMGCPEGVNPDLYAKEIERIADRLEDNADSI